MRYVGIERLRIFFGLRSYGEQRLLLQKIAATCSGPDRALLASFGPFANFQERLKTHSTAFNGLLSLIPAKYYYDDATQDQWKQKKKLKKEVSKDKRAKLDPESAADADSYNNAGASAKDVMENKAKSAKNVVLPGQTKSETAPAEKPNEQLNLGAETNSEAGLISEDGPQMVFDDEGNEVESSVAEKPKSQKKVLSPEEQKAREQRRAELKKKLASKISLLREKRKAPGTKTGGPVKSREQMLAERKKRQEAKRQEKLKRKHEDEQADSSSSSSSDEDSDKSDAEDAEDANVLFGNIVFKDGSRATSDLSKVRSGVAQKKKKGPSNNDIKAHMQKLEAKRRKLDSLTPEERAKQEEKDKWQSLMSQAEGIKVKDDEKLLKKALKRKEKQKLKSEIEWKERKQVVKDTIAARQKRREANLKSRRENKGKKGKHQPRLKKFTGTVNKGGKGKDAKKRAGFEGSAKSKGKLK